MRDVNATEADWGNAKSWWRIMGNLNLAHWIIVGASLAVTLYGWWVSQTQIEERARGRFERETTKVRDLVLERLQRYEDALWAGAAYVESLGGDLSVDEWKAYAEQLAIDKKYPGINGIGVIHYLEDERSLAQYLEEQRVLRPHFKIHPEVEIGENWPISYITPVAGNEQAIGLDMAHETNRYTAAKKARDRSMAQITGPIVLVQDAQQTPGFLFFVPFYEYADESADERKFRGLIYAPFVFKRLMDGILARDFRHVGIEILDKKALMFRDVSDGDLWYDPEPLFSSVETVSVYGREWEFRFRTDLKFRQDAGSTQPLIILASGIMVDVLLLMLFASIMRSSKRSQLQTEDLRRVQAELSRANEELTQFNYRTSHDLAAPLKTIQGFVDLAKLDLKKQDYESLAHMIDRIGSQAKRLDDLVKDLLNLCRIDHVNTDLEPVNCKEMVESVFESLSALAADHDVSMRSECLIDEPLLSQPSRVMQVVENLVSNAIKYSDAAKSERWVVVRFEEDFGDWAKIEVEDNGIGIPEDVGERVFEIFYRVGNNSEPGSGIGAYLVRKHVDALGGSVHYKTTPEGTCFSVRIPHQWTKRK